MSDAMPDLDALAAAAEAEPSRGWFKEDGNEGTEYFPMWMVVNDAFHNPPADEDEPWLAVEIHTGTEQTADFIAAANPTTILALIAHVRDLEAAVERVRALAKPVMVPDASDGMVRHDTGFAHSAALCCNQCFGFPHTECINKQDITAALDATEGES